MESLQAANARITDLERESANLRDQLREALKLGDLQGADLDRLREMLRALQPHQPERVPQAGLQLAFAELLASFPASNENAAAVQAAAAKARETSSDEPSSDRGASANARGHRRGRRRMDRTTLPVREVTVDPPEVLEDDGVGWELIGVETSERLSREYGGYSRTRFLLRKWKRMEPTNGAGSGRADDPSAPAAEIVTAPLPECVSPRAMADASTVAHVIVSKYDDALPLYRQEKISARDGFVIPRSTQCSFLRAAYADVHRVVDAMAVEGLSLSHVIATDATSAPVRAAKGERCEKWHVFVFVMEHHHVVFRHSQVHDGNAVRAMLGGYRGLLLSDASKIYDTLHESGMTEAADWSHCRRYFWESLPSDRMRAMSALALIAKLFEVEADAKEVTPDKRLLMRRARAGPVLQLFDDWIARERPNLLPKTPIARAVGYYDNQREALGRFLDDGALPIHNNVSERQLRNLVLGRSNWMWFQNEVGLKWYCTFRSLIASSVLHGLNPEEYLDQLLRLAPHWPTTRMIELSPKYWRRTLAGLDARQRLIVTPPWKLTSSTLDARRPSRIARAA